MLRTIVPDVIGDQDICEIEGATSVGAAARLMAERHIGAVLIADGGDMKGIFTERDLLSRVVSKGLDPDATSVADVMTSDPVTIAPDVTVLDALAVMQQHGFRHLPVVADGRTVGVLSIRDLYAVVMTQLKDDIRDRDAFMFGTSADA